MFLIVAFLFWAVVGTFILRWAELSERIRQATRKALLVAAILCFAVAPFLPGSYSQDVIVFIGGPNAFIPETITRSLTILAAGLGTALLGIWALSIWGDALPGRGPVRRALRLSFTLILLRVLLEKLAAPAEVALLAGIIWLAVPIGLYFGSEAAKLGSQRAYWKWLATYAWCVRLVVASMMVVATYFNLGTHFDNSSMTHTAADGATRTIEVVSLGDYANFIFFPQFLLWPVVTLVFASVVGLPVYFWKRRG